MINQPTKKRVKLEKEREREWVGSGRGSKGTIYGGREVKKEGAKCPENLQWLINAVLFYYYCK